MREINQGSSPQENYLSHLFPHEPTELFSQARQASQSLGKAAISMSADEARLMSTLIRSHACENFVEIGTLTGASALWILQGLSEQSELWTFEKDPAHAKAAQMIFDLFKKENPKGKKKIHLLEGDATEMLSQIEDQAPFDGIFIDGNKAAYGKYLDWAEKNVKKGGLILADNIFLGGSVFTGNTAKFSKKQIEVMRDFNQRLADPKNYQSAVIPTGEGLFMALKLF